MIKFRAWNQIDSEYINEINAVMSLDGSHIWWDINDSGEMKYEDDPGNYKLEQFTGLKDTSSKEIYEGDIVYFGSMWCVGDEYDPREEEHTGTVEYRPDYASYVVNCNGKIYPLEELTSFDGYSVQGNVHENAELLEEDK
ncbi:YopX family protein [Lactiplantibacillus paraplantarum]|uniref:YopX family protein n=1 Tax=Lactiplantibacillus paraplantarum TaxID=60520 RepID=UPI002073C3F0|nr:YopX family protein [Lactiplantibacillus paraplantarum]